MATTMDNWELLRDRLLPQLERLYPSHDAAELAASIRDRLQAHQFTLPTPNEQAGTLSERESLLISYGDSIVGPGKKPLQYLKQFLDDQCAGVISAVHVLPFYPFSSDDGFSVIDYRAVRDDLGDWQDIQSIAEDYRLMVDLVINHISAESDWFQEYCRGERPNYFIEACADDDLTQVTRPRASPLLRPTETSNGFKQIWCTFSHDQIDVNFSNPQVLLEYLEIIAIYLQHGTKIIRLDAIGYLWKQPGTTCIHLPETHEVVRLIRNVCDCVSPGTKLITETNVPNIENLTYFGNRNEAHAIYNFSLPPLLIHALLTGETKHLKKWMMSMPPAPDDCYYLNFTASHDGIGMRPAEGLLSPQEQHQMIETIRGFGGKLSTRQTPDGSQRVYELNISLFDALQGTVQGKDQFGIARFLCSQTVMMGVEGIPAFYIHSLLATPNDEVKLAATGRNRSINRHQWDIADLEDRLADPSSNQSIVLNELLRRIKIRSQQPAFHPNATQFTLQLHESFFAFWRQSRDRTQSIFAIHNVTTQAETLRISDLNLIAMDSWWNLLTGQKLSDSSDDIVLAPYQCLWISNRAP